jgi:hypothetical protein
MRSTDQANGEARAKEGNRRTVIRCTPPLPSGYPSSRARPEILHLKWDMLISKRELPLLPTSKTERLSC